MDVKIVNEAFLRGLTVEVWQDGELIGTGKIVQHTLHTIKLSDGMHYFKSTYQIKISRDSRLPG